MTAFRKHLSSIEIFSIFGITFPADLSSHLGITQTQIRNTTLKHFRFIMQWQNVA